MIDTNTPKGAITAAALRLAAEQPWSDITLADIAEAASVTLVALKKEFASKGEILAAFTEAVDDEVLTRAPARTPGQATRDALFEVIMSRFDVLAPYKSALRSIVPSLTPDPAQIRPILASQRWMLEAAGVGTGGLQGGVRIAGLASVYGAVFRTWLSDDDPGMARTMAALDRRLRRGERVLVRLEGACTGLMRVVAAAMPRGFERREADEERQERAQPAPDASSGPSTGPGV